MRPPKEIPDSAKEDLSRALKESRTKREYQRVLCIWLRVIMGLSADQIAFAVGLSVSSVWRIHSIYLREGEAALVCAEGRGGRRNQNMSKEEEEMFLQQFFQEAEKGDILEVSRVKAAYEKHVSHQVPKSTIYRMLDRHGWRKIAPGSRHPKADPVVMEDFKKNFPSS